MLVGKNICVTASDVAGGFVVSNRGRIRVFTSTVRTSTGSEAPHMPVGIACLRKTSSVVGFVRGEGGASKVDGWFCYTRRS